MVLLAVILYAPLFLAVIYPCDNSSDFVGTNKVYTGRPCQYYVNNWKTYIPSSRKECASPKKQNLVGLYGRCCKPGSKPNGICGFERRITTPCKSKAHGEFLPEAKWAEHYHAVGKDVGVCVCVCVCVCVNWILWCQCEVIAHTRTLGHAHPH